MTKLDRLICKMQEKDWDALILTSYANRYYVSGFSGSAGLVLITLHNKYILVDGRYTLQAKKEAKGFEVIECKGSLIKNLGSFSIKRVGFEADKLSYNEYKLLKETLPGIILHDCSKILKELRIIKDQSEINKIRESMALADRAFKHICGYIKEGVTEREIAIELEFYMRRHGATALSFDTIVASGVRGAMPHGAPTDKPIKKGDMVVMDFGCVLSGYCSDITRTVVVGEASQEQKNIYNAVLKAQTNTIKAVKKGAAVSEIDAIARKVIKDEGYDRYFTHAIGHGVGVEVHEEPRISKINKEILSENMVITIEPGIYISNLGGVRIEDLLVVKKDGYENLTKSEKNLMLV